MSISTQDSILKIVILLALTLIAIQGCTTGAAKTPPRPSGALALIEPPVTKQPTPVEDDPFAEEDLLFDDDEFEDEFQQEDVPLVSDPLAPINRVMFSFNDAVLIYVVKPVALGYKAITPTPFRHGIRNVFTNLQMPIRFINCLLQGKIKGAGDELGRFLVNSTIGVLGIGDPASDWLEIPPNHEDLGQTLGHWGVGNGPYIVWPIFGPSTLRDSTNLVETLYPSPITYNQEAVYKVGVTTFEKINEASFSITDYENLIKSALDPYTFVRELYIQNRNKKVRE